MHARRVTRRRGRPPTSPLTRAEQLRIAKKAQRERERAAGLKAINIALPAERARRLRLAWQQPEFRDAVEGLLQDFLIDLHAWPALRELAWNRKTRWVTGPEALAIYERNWRFVEPDRLAAEERALIDRLRSRFAGGVPNV